METRGSAFQKTVGHLEAKNLYLGASNAVGVLE
jgi:hypothetical protein